MKQIRRRENKARGRAAGLRGPEIKHRQRQWNDKRQLALKLIFVALCSKHQFSSGGYVNCKRQRRQQCTRRQFALCITVLSAAIKRRIIGVVKFPPEMQNATAGPLGAPGTDRRSTKTTLYVRR